MTNFFHRIPRMASVSKATPLLRLSFAVLLAAATACASSSPSAAGAAMGEVEPEAAVDPRVGLRAGLHDAAEATWNLEVVSRNPSPDMSAT